MDAGSTDAGPVCLPLGGLGCSMDAGCCNSLQCHAGRCETANDSCAFAQVFNFPLAGGTKGEAFGSTVGSLNDESSCQGPGEDVYYQFSAEGSLSVEVTALFDAGFLPTVALKGSCSSTPTACATGDGGTASFTATGLPPRVWHVVVDGRTATPGAFKLTVTGSRTNLLTGDVCGDERPALLGPPTFSTQLGTFDTTPLVSAGDPANPCTGNFRDRVYRLEATRGGNLTVSLTPNSAWDVALALSQGPDCERATAVVSCVDLAAASGTETFSHQVPDGGGVYYLWVSGDSSSDFGSYMGSATLQ